MKTWLIEEWRDESGLWGDWVSTHFRLCARESAERVLRELDGGGEFVTLRVREE